jgi:hypothetical protein
VVADTDAIVCRVLDTNAAADAAGRRLALDVRTVLL